MAEGAVQVDVAAVVASLPAVDLYSHLVDLAYVIAYVC